MTAYQASCPMSRTTTIDAYFLEHRAKLIDIAAFLDRIDRSDAQTGGEDFRIKAYTRALSVITDDKGDYARRVLEVFSDPTTEPIADAGTKGAAGACPETE